MIRETMKLQMLLQEKLENVMSQIPKAPPPPEIPCPNKPKPCPAPQAPNVLIVQGQGIMAISGSDQPLLQCSVTFTLTLWDYGCNKSFQMEICSPSPDLNHDSGVVSVTWGDLKIKNI